MWLSVTGCPGFRIRHLAIYVLAYLENKWAAHDQVEGRGNMTDVRRIDSLLTFLDLTGYKI